MRKIIIGIFIRPVRLRARIQDEDPLRGSGEKRRGRGHVGFVLCATQGGREREVVSSAEEEGDGRRGGW